MSSVVSNGYERFAPERREVGDGRFLLREKIGSGSFGEVFLGKSVHTDEDVAIKLESTLAKHPQLRYEMKILKELQGGTGVATLHYYGVEEHYSVLVSSLLGKSLEDLFNLCRRRFTPGCVMLIGEQLVDRIEYMHDKNFIHRDIKPDNFLIGRGNEKDLIYIIDFGLSKKFYYPNKERHIPFREGKNLTGTPRYASINNHCGFEQSRRDDMESIGYVLAYFARGKLPWQGLKAPNKAEKYEKIKNKKERVSLEELCTGLPHEIYEFLAYSKALKFEERPDYEYLRGLFRRAVESRKYGDPSKVVFDWLRDMRNPYKDQRPSRGERPANRTRTRHHDGVDDSGKGNVPSSMRNRHRPVEPNDTRDSVQRTNRASADRERQLERPPPSSRRQRTHNRGKKDEQEFRVIRAPAVAFRPKTANLFDDDK